MGWEDKGVHAPLERFALRGRYAQLASGDLDVSTLDDEELARGQLRAADGTFRGRPPKFFPAVLVNAMRKEYLTRVNGRLHKALLDAGVGTLVELAQDPNVDASVRLRAATTIIERGLGKVPEKIVVGHSDPVQEMLESIMRDPDGLLEPVAPPHEPSPAVTGGNDHGQDVVPSVGSADVA